MLAKELERRRKRAGSWRGLAEEIGLDHAYLWSVCRGKKPGSKKLFDALGLEAVTTYRRKK